MIVPNASSLRPWPFDVIIVLEVATHYGIRSLVLLNKYPSALSLELRTSQTTLQFIYRTVVFPGCCRWSLHRSRCHCGPRMPIVTGWRTGGGGTFFRGHLVL